MSDNWNRDLAQVQCEIREYEAAQLRFLASRGKRRDRRAQPQPTVLLAAVERAEALVRQRLSEDDPTVARLRRTVNNVCDLAGQPRRFLLTAR